MGQDECAQASDPRACRAESYWGLGNSIDPYVNPLSDSLSLFGVLAFLGEDANEQPITFPAAFFVDFLSENGGGTNQDEPHTQQPSGMQPCLNKVQSAVNNDLGTQSNYLGPTTGQGLDANGMRGGAYNFNFFAPGVFFGPPTASTRFQVQIAAGSAMACTFRFRGSPATLAVIQQYHRGERPTAVLS